MESTKIEILLDKYFQGTTSIAEENELKNYFSCLNVAPHLEQYKPMFGYFSKAKEQQFKKMVALQTKKRALAWLSIAASIIVLLGIGTYAYVNNNNANQNQNLGTYDDPQKAFEATQQALSMLSNHVNTGIESVQYVKEYETAKNRIFRK